jgi:hypothetical protein
MTAYPLSNGYLTGPQAEIGATLVGSEPDHAVSVDLEDLEYLSLIGLQSELILLRQSSGA